MRVSTENRFYPWLVWSLAATFFFYKYLLQVSPSVMSEDLMRSFAASGAQLGNLAACFFYSYLILQIPVGILLDRYNPRYITSLAIAISALGVLLFSFAQSLFSAYFARALIGCGAAFAAVSCFKFVTLWFPPRRFALLAGLSMTAAMCGAIGGQLPLSLLVKHFEWQEAMRYIAIPGLMLATLFFVVVKNRSESTSQGALTGLNLRQQLLLIVRSKQAWLLSFYSGLAFAPVSVFGGLWGVSFLKQAYQLSPSEAATAISFIFIGFAIGCPLSGWLSDYMQRRKSLMLGGTLVAILTLSGVLYLPHSHTGLLSFLLFLFGLGASCFFLCFAMIRETLPLAIAATVLGFMNTFDSICEALSEPLIGKILDMGWEGAMIKGARVFSVHDYHLSLGLLVFYLVVALVFLFFTKETYCQQSRSPLVTDHEVTLHSCA